MQKKKKNHGIWSHHFMANGWETVETGADFIFWGAPNSLQMVTEAMKLKDAYSLDGPLKSPRWKHSFNKALTTSQIQSISTGITLLSICNYFHVSW